MEITAFYLVLAVMVLFVLLLGIAIFLYFTCARKSSTSMHMIPTVLLPAEVPQQYAEEVEYTQNPCGTNSTRQHNPYVLYPRRVSLLACDADFLAY